MDSMYQQFEILLNTIAVVITFSTLHSVHDCFEKQGEHRRGLLCVRPEVIFSGRLEDVSSLCKRERGEEISRGRLTRSSRRSQASPRSRQGSPS